jgi:hypothetical protein
MKASTQRAPVTIVAALFAATLARAQALNGSQTPAERPGPQ